MADGNGFRWSVGTDDCPLTTIHLPALSKIHIRNRSTLLNQIVICCSWVRWGRAKQLISVDIDGRFAAVGQDRLNIHKKTDLRLNFEF